MGSFETPSAGFASKKEEDPDNRVHFGDNKEKQMEKDPRLSAGWKATAAITGGLLLGAKLYKWPMVFGGGLDKKDMEKIKEKGGFLKSIASKAAEVYGAIEKIEDIADNFDFETLSKQYEKDIESAGTDEEREKLKTEFEEISQKRKRETEDRGKSKKTRNSIWETLGGLAK